MTVCYKHNDSAATKEQIQAGNACDFNSEMAFNLTDTNSQRVKCKMDGTYIFMAFAADPT